MDNYSNHVLLNGLEETRAHQRGEGVGRSAPAPKRKSPKPKEEANQGRGKLTAEARRAVATHPGNAKEVAAEFNLALCSVYAIRNAYRSTQNGSD